MNTKRTPVQVGSRRRATVAEEALDANALELFARITQAGSFAQAARDLGLTRAAISRRIAAIEAAVGLSLFARSTRSLGLTEAGRRLHARARAVHEAAQGARLALRHTRDQLDGTLRISATPAFGRHVLAPLLASFQREHPAVRLELFFTDRRVDLLREGLDVAFRITHTPPETWVAQPVMTFKVLAYGLRGSPAVASPEALINSPLLMLGQGEEPFVSHWVHDDGRKLELPLQATCWGSDLDGLIAMAEHGGGVVVAPDFCCRPVRWPPAAGDPHGAAGAPALRSPLVDVLPGWRMHVGLEVVQALTLPFPAISEAGRQLVRHVKAGVDASLNLQLETARGGI